MPPQVSEGHRWAVLRGGGVKLSPLVTFVSRTPTARGLPSHNPWHGKNTCNAKKSSRSGLIARPPEPLVVSSQLALDSDGFQAGHTEDALVYSAARGHLGHCL